MLKKTIVTILIMVSTALTSSASLAAGFGFALSINMKGEIGAGPRIFTSKIVNKIVGSAGVNYNFMSKDFEPIFGLGYTFDNSFIGAEASYRIKQKDFKANGTIAVR